MSSSNFNLPVSVPVGGTYGEASMLQTSPQLVHQSISPRPSSSETDSGKFSFSNYYNFLFGNFILTNILL